MSHLVVNGTINGPVHADESLELQANSRVKGDIHYTSVEMQQGAIVEAGWCIPAARRKRWV